MIKVLAHQENEKSPMTSLSSSFFFFRKVREMWVLFEIFLYNLKKNVGSLRHLVALLDHLT